MQVLVADDDLISRRVLTNLLTEWGHEVIECEDGTKAWWTIEHEATLSIAILDWQMPGLTGPEICTLARDNMRHRPLHLIILTGTRLGVDSLVTVFEAGANDYLNKPFEPRELRARLRVGERMVELRRELEARIKELEATLANVRQLQGLLPICAICKRVRDDQDYWHDVELYVMQHSEAVFSHSLCPECCRAHYPEHAHTVLGDKTGESAKT